MKDVKAGFPLPGQYHFRFKMKWESGAVWMDVTNEESMVPMFEDKVIAKVLRVNWGKAQKPVPSDVPSASPDTSPLASGDSEDLLFGESSAPQVGQPKTSGKDDFDMLFG